MKKKILTFMLAICLVIPCMFTLVACSKGGDPHKNSEFDEFKTIITSVLDRYTFEESIASAHINAKLMSAMATPMSLTQNDRTDLLNMINNDSNKTQVNANYYYQDAFEQSFYMPLICGEVYAYTLEEDNFYGQKMLMETNNQYLMVESSGTHKYIYCYTPAGTIYDENHFDVLDLNYVSPNDFEFTMIGFNADYSQVSYIFGDESKSIVVISKNTNGDSGSNFVVATLGGTAYESQSDSILTSAFNLISSEVQAQDKTKIQSTITGYTTISNEAYQTAMDKYFNDEGGEKTNSIEWVISQGHLLAYNGTETEITIPLSVTSISNHFTVPSTVTKLTIPKSITAIENNPQEGNMTGFDLYLQFEWEIDSVTEIIVEQGSPLFKSINGNLYTHDDRLLWIANGEAITDLTISESNITKQFLRKIPQMPNLKNLTFVDSEYYGGSYGYSESLVKIFNTQTKNNYELETVSLNNLMTVTQTINLSEIFVGKVLSIQTLNIAVEPYPYKQDVFLSGNVSVEQINVDDNTNLITDEI